MFNRLHQPKRNGLLRLIVILTTLFAACYFLKKLFRARTHTAILLGCKTRKDGTMSTSQKKRSDAAIRAYERGLYDQLVISGGNTGGEMSEARIMAEYIEANAPHPIPIMLEQESKNTFENFANAAKVIDDPEILIITSSNHALRSKLIAKQFFKKVRNYSALEIRPKHLLRELASLQLYFLIELKKLLHLPY